MIAVASTCGIPLQASQGELPGRFTNCFLGIGHLGRRPGDLPRLGL